MTFALRMLLRFSRARIQSAGQGLSLIHISDEIAASIRQKFGTAVEIRAMRSNHLEMV